MFTLIFKNKINSEAILVKRATVSNVTTSSNDDPNVKEFSLLFNFYGEGDAKCTYRFKNAAVINAYVSDLNATIHAYALEKTINEVYGKAIGLNDFAEKFHAIAADLKEKYIPDKESTEFNSRVQSKVNLRNQGYGGSDFKSIKL